MAGSTPFTKWQVPPSSLADMDSQSDGHGDGDDQPMSFSSISYGSIHEWARQGHKNKRRHCETLKQAEMKQQMAGRTAFIKWQAPPSSSGDTDSESDGDGDDQPMSFSSISYGSISDGFMSDSSISEDSIDKRSIQGHFGFEEIGIMSIPYIFRESEKYCALRIIETKVLSFFFKCLHPDICLTVPTVTSLNLTEAEADLFNEINEDHCNLEYGDYFFTQQDLIVHLDDANAFYQYLNDFHKLLTNSTTTDRCGFLQINKKSVVPYIVRNEKRFVPSFYFECDVNLECHGERLIGWDLAYMRCCCIIQGIKESLFSQDMIVLPLDFLLRHFPKGTQIQTCSLNHFENFLFKEDYKYQPFVWHVQNID